MTLPQLKNKFDNLLTNINGSTSTNFSTSVENGFEALTLASVMLEYKRVYGKIKKLSPPIHSNFLNQKPGKFRTERSYKLDFHNRESFYFAADIEVFGLEAFKQNKPVGILFEIDVVVIPSLYSSEIIKDFFGYPGPQHIHSAYECKFGSYHKGQLRELLGLKRHLCYLCGPPSTTPQLFNCQILQSKPCIALKMARPKRHKFLDKTTALLYDLEQIIVN